MFRIRSLALANGLSLLTSGLVPAVFFFVSLYLQQGLGMDPLQAGIALLPAGLGMVVGAQTGPRLLRRFPLRAVYLGACLLSVGSLLWLSRFGSGGGSARDVLLPLFLATVGFGAAGLPITLSATSGVGPTAPGWRPGCSTPPARSAAPWGWPAWWSSPRPSPGGPPRTAARRWRH